MKLLNYNYTIGTTDSTYPAGTSLTDSLIGIAHIAAVQKGAQSYNDGWTVSGRTLHHGDSFITVNGDTVTIHFQTLLEITL